MQASDRAEFVRVLNGLAAIKPGAKLTPEGLDLWWATMSDWSIETFRAAASSLAKSCEFMPNPYHFEQWRKSLGPTSGEAWAKVLDHVRSGAWRHSRIDDDRINTAVRALGGYVQVAMCSDEKLGFLERRFAEHYETACDAHEVRALIAPLDKLLLKSTA